MTQKGLLKGVSNAARTPLTIFITGRATGMNPRGIAIALFFVLLSTFVALCLGSLGIIRFPASNAPKSFKSIDPPVYNPNVRINRAC